MLRHRLLQAALLGTALAGCSSDPSPPTGSSAPPAVPAGTQLVAGTFTLRGMTSDGWVIYSDDQTLNLHAAPIAGGSPQDIVSLGDDFAVSVWGGTVFVWSSKNMASVGKLTVWTSSGGSHAVSSSSLATWVAATGDGSQMLYLDGVDAAGQTGNLVAAGANGASPHTLLTGVTGLSTAGCQPVLGFAGAYAVVPHCSGGTSPTLSSFDTAAWKQMDLATGASNSWSTDPAGTVLLTATSAGTVLVPLGGGLPTVIDPSGTAGWLVNNGQAALYGASGGALRHSMVSAPSPTTLVTSGFGGLYGVSPDGTLALYYGTKDAKTQISDLYLTSTSMAGATTTLSGSKTAGIFGDAFTVDGSHLLYGTNVDSNAQTMTLNVLTPGGGSPRVISDKGYVIWASTGAKVVYAENVAFNGLHPNVDIRSLDTSQSGDATLIVSEGDADFFFSPAHDKLVYTWSVGDAAGQGIYVTALP